MGRAQSLKYPLGVKAVMVQEKQVKKLACFPGSFDPFTLGHLDVVEQALDVFDEVVIAIGKSGAKTSLFSFDERIESIQSLFPAKGRVQVQAFQGLAVDFAESIGACALIRGLRNESDFAYEMPMAMTNRSLNSRLKTVFFLTKTDFAYISSSLVKEVFTNHGDVSGFVPQKILTRLQKKYNR